MKRLLILTAVAMLTAASLGCCHQNWLRRGAPCNTCSPGGSYAGETIVAPPYGGDMYVPGPG